MSIVFDVAIGVFVGMIAYRVFSGVILGLFESFIPKKEKGDGLSG